MKKKKDKKKILFISSTGGHLSEMLQLKKMFEDYEYHIVTEKDKSNITLKDKYPDHVTYLVYGTKKNILVYPFKLLFNTFKSLRIFLREKPCAIITTGTHTAVPMCFIAKLFRKKVIYIETLANSNTKTVAGRIVYPIADLFVVQWEEMIKLYPKAKYWGMIY